MYDVLRDPQAWAKAGVVALVIGVTLALVNQWDGILGAARLDMLPLVMVFVTPFVVVMLSQIVAVERFRKDAGAGRILRDGGRSFGRIVASHGIPTRAALIGLAMGGLNTALMAAQSLAATGSLAGLDATVAAQALALPMVFSTIAQGAVYMKLARAATA